MVQIYYGDGKGKTTAACGLAARAAGHGIPVFFVQFLKNDTSGEVRMLKKLGMDVLHPSVFHGFLSRMDGAQKDETRHDCAQMLVKTADWLQKILQGKTADECGHGESAGQLTEVPMGTDMPAAVVVWDEILHAIHFGLLDESSVMPVLNRYREDAEFILTGRNPSENMLSAADYATEMKNIRHPYEKGISARKGIEL